MQEKEILSCSTEKGSLYIKWTSIKIRFSPKTFWYMHVNQ